MFNIIRKYICNTFGSRRGLLNLSKAQCIYWLGGYRGYQKIDWSRVDRLIFICQGNICRSPLGEAVAYQKFDLRAESFGLDCRDGAPADSRAIGFAESVGIDLTKHASRHIQSYSPTQFDLVVAMEPKHLLQLPAETRSIAQVTLVGLWQPSPCPYVHDPYSACEQYFERCERMVMAGTKGVATQCLSVKK